MEGEKNYAFIDSVNLYLGVRKLGWNLDYKEFRTYLRKKYGIEKSYLFIGFVSNNEYLYKKLQEAGFIIIFKPTIPDEKGEIKGNCDTDLVLWAMIDYNKYNKAIIISGDGDFYSLVRYLYDNNKLLRVIAPNRRESSFLLRREAKEKIIFIDDLKKQLEYRKKSEPRERPHFS